PAVCEAAFDGIRGIKRRYTDFKIVVGDREFYVNRGLLATYCEYFDGFFYGDFEDRYRDEISLDDVDADDFDKFMRLILPPQESINGSNIAAVMPLAHRFLARTIMEKCEQYIVDKIMNISKSVPILDKCGMTDTIEHLFEGVRDFELRALTKDDTLSQLSSATKTIIIKELKRRLQMP
ncbi:Protein BATH-47, partial [Aphelenchoides avenae]